MSCNRSAGGTKVFVIGKDNDRLYEWNFSANKWVNAGRTVQSVAIDNNNHVWTVENGSIFRYSNGDWEKMLGAAKAVSAGGTKVFVIGKDNDGLYEWNPATKAWMRGGRTVQSVAVGAKNTIWIVEDFSIYTLYY